MRNFKSVPTVHVHTVIGNVFKNFAELLTLETFMSVLCLNKGQHNQNCQLADSYLETKTISANKYT